MVNMYLDDLRNPPPIKEWLILRSSAEAIEYVQDHGMPEYCSFDHDLGGDDTTMVFLKWLVDFDMDNDGKIIPENFTYDVHSANPVGVKNISGLLQNYLDFKKNQN